MNKKLKILLLGMVLVYSVVGSASAVPIPFDGTADNISLYILEENMQKNEFNVYEYVFFKNSIYSSSSFYPSSVYSGGAEVIEYVPEPTAMLLFGAGILAISSFRLKIRKACRRKSVK